MRGQDHEPEEGDVSDEVDLIVVLDHELAEHVVKVLERAGIHHVEFWPEHVLDHYGGMATIGRAWPRGDRTGPFHIRVRVEDVHEANVVLLNSGLMRGKGG